MTVVQQDIVRGFFQAWSWPVWWRRLWRLHEETKRLLFGWTNPQNWFCGLNTRACMQAEDPRREKEANLADGLGAASLEHNPLRRREPGGGGEERPGPYRRSQLAGLLGGPIVCLVVMLLPTPGGMTPPAQRMAGVALLMATWWISEAVPIPVTSLLPLVLMPMLGILHMKDVSAPYANHLIFLFMGGFLIALSMQRWNLHRRIAMTLVRAVGFSPSRLILGFMVATASLSAFVSNTATAVMMMPIGLAIIIHVVEEGKKEGLDKVMDLSPGTFNFGTGLMLGIAYAASIGGMATLIGTPPNTILAGYMQKAYNFEITFIEWLKVGLPLAGVLLFTCWIWLTRIIYPLRLKKVPGGRAMIQEELRRMGPMKTGERWTARVFVCTAAAWVLRPKLAALFPDPAMVTDATIAMTGAVLLFLIPVNLKNNQFVMNWHWANKMPWGVLILFGGGLALAEGFKQTQLADWIGAQVNLLGEAPILLLILAVTALIIFLTELTSNTATSAMAMPVLAAVAIGLGQHPLLLVIPGALAASCAFMLPVATPPNAIIFGSGYITIPQMARSGLGLNLLALALIVLATWFLAVPVFDVTIGELPAWIAGPE